MKTPITYYGGKQLLASKIVSMIPDHRIYCEPYFGGGAVFFAKDPSYLEAINDLNDRLMIFYDCLRTKYSELNALIQGTLNSEFQHRKAKEIYYGVREASDVEIAWSVWVVTSLSFAATPRGGWKWSNGSAGSHTGRMVAHHRERFTEALSERLKYVQISSRPAIKVIRERDTDGTFFYLDPPYPGCNQKHYSGFTDEDLAELLDELEGIKGKFILSNYGRDCLMERVEKCHWNYKVIDMPLKCANFNGKKRRKQEIIVWNYTTE